MKFIVTLFSLLIATYTFASEGGDLLSANTGTNIREGNTLNAPVMRIAKADEVFYRISNNEENGFIQIKLQDGTTGWIYEKYTYRLVDKVKTPAVTTTTTKG